jgi:hypothetical protein
MVEKLERSSIFSTIAELPPDTCTAVHRNIIYCTECNRRNGPDFGMLFLMLNYIEKPQNTYNQVERFGR